MNYFAGIGSRQTPLETMNQMESISKAFTQLGYILRSGGAKRADESFEKGVCDPKYKEIFYSKDATPEAIELALKYHPNPAAVRNKGNYVLGLMGRNMQILLGKYLNTPVDFVVCWTPNGAITGGTGQALRYCLEHNIKVYNLAKLNDLEELRSFYLKKKEMLIIK